MAIRCSPTIIDGIESPSVTSKKLLDFITSHVVDGFDVATKCPTRRRLSLGIQICEDLDELVIFDDLVRLMATSNPLNKPQAVFTLSEFVRDVLVNSQLSETVQSLTASDVDLEIGSRSVSNPPDASLFVTE